MAANGTRRLKLSFKFGNQSGRPSGILPVHFIGKIIRILKQGKVTVLEINTSTQLDIPLLRSSKDTIRLLEIKCRYTVGSLALKMAEERSITLYMLTDSMYVVGFKSKGQIWELREKREFMNIIGGARPLRVNGSYTGGNSIGESSTVTYSIQDPDNPNKKKTVAAPFRRRAVLCRKSLFEHLETLFNYNHEDKNSDHVVSKALIFMVQLFAEAPRFVAIKAHVCSQWLMKPTEEEKEDELEQQEIKTGVRVEYGKIARRLPEKLVDIQNDWKKMSERVQRKEPVTDHLGIAMLYEKRKKDEDEDDKRKRDDEEDKKKKRKLKGKDVMKGGSSKKEKQAREEKRGKGISIGGK